MAYFYLAGERLPKATVFGKLNPISTSEWV